jgi:hypothetical protein
MVVPYFVFVSVFFTAVIFCSSLSLLGKSLNSSLVESSILVNINSLKTSKDFPSQRRLSEADTSVIENSIYEELIDIPQESQALKLSMVETFGNIPANQSIEAFTHAVDYLSDKKLDFSLSNEEFLSGLTSIISAFAETSAAEDVIKEIPQIIFNQIIPDKIINWGGGGQSWGAMLSQAIISTIPYSDDIPSTTQVEILSRAILESTMAFYESTNPNMTNVGIYPGINPIVSYDEPNDVMKFDGKEQFMKFDPSKTEIINSVSFGISSALFSSSLISEDTLGDFSLSIAKSTIDGALSFVDQVENKNPDQSHSFFVNEITKAISHGIVLGAVSTLARDEESNVLELPGNAAKLLSENLAYSAINKTLELDKTNWELERIAESSAFGAATGSQLAAVFDKSLDYTESWESYERKQLAKSTSEGSALGSTTARIEKVVKDFSEATNEDDSLNIADTARNDLLAISQHSAMGSLIGNVGMSLYYPNPMDKLALINFAAQGATTGSISGTSEVDLKRQDSTETFDVEIARSSSVGASFGAVFETVALTNANPKDFSNDISVTSVVQAVTYGTTYGAITAGDKNDAPVADALVFKQATKQGAIEGSLSGASLGSGISAENADDTDLRAKSSIIKAASETNAQAAANASSTMATKVIRTSTSDMLMLMKKFGINPRLTNPTKIFKKKTTRNEEDDFLFKEELKVATPI